MNTKWFIYGVPILILALSIAVMTSGSLLKKPLLADDDVFRLVRELEQVVKQKDWALARAKSAEASKAWHHVVNRIQFSVEREMIMEISGTLARIKGAAEAEDEQSVLTEVYYFYDLWNNLAS